MLLYLINTQPDIQYAVNSCARFTHNPKASHAEGVRRICRYLQKTKDRGLVFRPYDGDDLRVDCYVDSDFCGLFGIEDPEDPVSSRSRTGFVLYVGYCPVHWASKLQPLTTLSTAEAEYVALADAMKTLLPLRRITLAVAKGLGLKMKDARVISKVFEDNQSCIAMAKAPALTARTQHINSRYHFFKQHVGPRTGIEIEYKPSEHNVADTFTKGLGVEKFIYHTLRLMGWETWPGDVPQDYLKQFKIWDASSLERECRKSIRVVTSGNGTADVNISSVLAKDPQTG